MKTLTRTLIITAIILLSNFVTRADWELYGPVTPPGLGATYWSLAHGTSYPPTPCIPLLFFESPVYQIVNWPGNYTYDDTENPDHQQLTAALVGTYPSTNTVNTWFTGLTNAQATVSTIGSGGVMCSDNARWFYCQSHLADDSSLPARTVMTNKGWTIFFAP